MKGKLLERLTRAFAPPARHLASFLAILATGAALATAPTPTVVWESDFGTATKTGSDGNSYTITLNDNTVNSDGNIEIASSATKGAIIDTSAASASSMTVLVRYKSAPAASASVVPISMYCYRTSGSVPDVGMVTYRANSYQNYACWYVQNGSREFNSTDGTDPVMSASGGLLMLSYDCSTLRVYAGNTIATLAGGAKAYAWGSSKMNYVGLGGPTGKTNGLQWNAWGGMVIEKVAIFPGNAYSNTDLADYVWPSAEKYQKWAYADTSRIVTWTTPSYAIANCIPAPAASYTVFDISTATDTDTTYTGGAATSTTGANWHYFCYSSNAGSEYVAPGSVLRFVSGDYKKSLAADYSPVTYGGIIVEEGATGYSFAEASRYSVLGDPTGATETWFEFNEDFTFGRSGGCHLTGTVNLDIASGKTFTIAGTTTKTATTAKSNILSGTAGGTLKLHGSGKLVATLNASSAKLDFSDQPTANASTSTAYIQGALTVDANTTFVFPDGATFPYFVATSISGDVDHSTGYKANADGSISQVVPAVLSITSAEAVNLPTTWTSDDDAVVNVYPNIDATVNVTAATTLSTITFYVPATSTLTISGAAITAGSINFDQPGVVKVTSSGALVGTAKGSGVVQYSGVLPTITSGISFSNAAWTGTMWLKDFGELSGGKVNSNLTADMASWGNTGSKVKFTNVKAYAPSSNVTCNYTLVLEDGTGSEEYAWRCDNGYSGYSVTFNALSGTGTFYDGGTVTAPFKFNALSDFTGVFNITGAGHKIGIGANCSSNGGTIALGSGIAVTFTDGHPWTTGNGFVVNNGATLNVNTDATVKFTDRGMLGTLNIAEGKTLTAASSDAVSYGSETGTVNVYGTLNFGTSRWTLGPNVVINLYEGATISGTGDSSNSNAALDFNVANGSTIHALGDATISCVIRNNYADGTAKINVDAGKTLTFSGNLVGSYGLKKQGDGILKLTGSIEKLPTIEAGTVLLGGNKEWNLGTLRDLTGYTLEAGSSIAITQTKEEYGSGVTTVAGVDSGIASITVNKPDGTTTTITPSDGAGALEETAVVSGSAICNHDYEFDNAWTDTGSDPKNAQTWDSADPNFLQDGDTSNWSVYTAVCPGNSSTFNLTGDWSAAIRCTVPQKGNGIIVAFGNKSSFVALAAGETENTARLVKGGGDNVVVTELATMSVAHAATAMHVYAFVKTANAVDIYCDGNLVTRYNGAIGNLNDGFQFGSVRSGVPSNCGLVRLYNSEKETGGNVDYMRIYNFAIDANMIAKLHNDHPYVSPSSVFSRTLDGESGLEWSATDAWTKGGETADTPDAEGIVELTATTDSSIAANLSTASLYETLTFTGAGAITVTKVANAATLSAVDVIVETDTTVAADAVDFTSSRVEVADGKTLTFDVSSIVTANGNWANAASVDRIQLTGIAALGTGASVAVSPATAGYWNLSAVEDGGYYYLSVAPNRATGEIYWQSGTYWNSTYSGGDSPATFTTDAAGTTPTKYFAGDTVVIPTKTQRYFGPISDGAAIKFDCGDVINVTKTDSLGYVFKNATITVASGTTLNFVNSWNGTAPEVYGGTISGAGKVKVESGKTLTLSNGATLASATALTGAGEVVLASVPTAQMTFDNWTGTVSLPSFAAGGTKLSFCGNSGSVVALAGIESGWFGETSSQRSDVVPTLRLDGAVTITGMSSSWSYSFAKITGTGNLSFTSATAPNSLTITEIAGYSGTLNNSTTTALTVERISLDSEPAAGAKLLSIGGTGTITVNSVYVNGFATPLDLEYKSDGVYVSEFQGIGYWTDTTLTITNTAALVEIPASATAATVYPSSSVVTLTGGAGLTSNIAVMAKYEGGEQDIGSAFTPAYNQETGVTTMTFNGSATVTVGDEAISVTPALAASEPVALAEEKPSFAVKTIPGLWYSLESCDTASGTFTAETTVQATSTTTSLTATAEPNPVKYYKLGVDVAAPAQ